MTDYTHDFILKLGDNFVMEGECEFNVDGEASFETTDPLTNLTVDQHRQIGFLFKALREIFKEFGWIKKIKFDEK